MAPIAEVGLPFQVMCQDPRIISGYDKPDRPINQNALGICELPILLDELVRVSHSSQRNSLLSRELFQKTYRVLSLRNFAKSPLPEVIQPCHDALLELPVEH